MRDKQRSKTTLNNVMHSDKSIQSIQQEKAESSIKAFKYTPEYADQAKQYNLNLTNLDSRYTSVKPIHKVIVRCALNEPQVTESGLVLPYKQLLSVQTNAGTGKVGEYETDWPYSEKAIVVSVPDHITSIKQGDIIQLSRDAVQNRVIGQGANAFPVVVNGFVHVDSKHDVTPKDITDVDYGYVLVSISDITAKYELV